MSTFAHRGSEGRSAPPIRGGAVPAPRRLHRTRRRANFTPAGAVYVGRPTIWSNPFSGGPRISHKRSVILYAAWLDGALSPHILMRTGFGHDEIAALRRWRDRVVDRLPALRGRDLQCWCPPTSDWCHATVLLRKANR